MRFTGDKLIPKARFDHLRVLGDRLIAIEIGTGRIKRDIPSSRLGRDRASRRRARSPDTGALNGCSTSSSNG
jgi:hypothetical protein